LGDGTPQTEQACGLTNPQKKGIVPSEGTLHFLRGGQALQVVAARDFDCASGLVAGVYQSDSIRGTALGKCFYPGIDFEQEQTPMNREQAELTKKNTWIGKAERRLPARRDGETNRNEPHRRPALRSR
jgi:hypothetical protein